jgi:hypothetical protein
MHVHILIYEEFKFTILNSEETVDWEEVIDLFMGEVALHG